MNEFNNPTNIFVDLGAGNGNFAKAVLEANIFKDVIASDISDSCINACKKQGLQTIKCTIEEFDNSSIDCITFNDLIEHVFDPYAFVLGCYNKLNLNGILMLSTPNGEGFDFKILKEKTENITPPEHIQYLTPFQVLLERVGLEVVR
jgi:2-polyprenyl-3-methyl-5-hydroxy-6-metoxy-1,4-benzoquinol methylase